MPERKKINKLRKIHARRWSSFESDLDPGEGKNVW